MGMDQLFYTARQIAGFVHGTLYHWYLMVHVSFLTTISTQWMKGSDNKNYHPDKMNYYRRKFS